MFYRPRGYRVTLIGETEHGGRGSLSRLAEQRVLGKEWRVQAGFGSSSCSSDSLEGRTPLGTRQCRDQDSVCGGQGMGLPELCPCMLGDRRPVPFRES